MKKFQIAITVFALSAAAVLFFGNDIMLLYSRWSLNLPKIEEVGNRYFDFCNNIYTDLISNNYKPKDLSRVNILKMKILLDNL